VGSAFRGLWEVLFTLSARVSEGCGKCYQRAVGSAFRGLWEVLSEGCGKCWQQEETCTFAASCAVGGSWTCSASVANIAKEDVDTSAEAEGEVRHRV
jgi:hypothetical protein